MAFEDIFAEAWNHAAPMGNATIGFWTIFSELFVRFVEIYCCTICMPYSYSDVIDCNAISCADGNNSGLGIYEY